MSAVPHEIINASDFFDFFFFFCARLETRGKSSLRGGGRGGSKGGREEGDDDGSASSVVRRLRADDAEMRDSPDRRAFGGERKTVQVLVLMLRLRLLPLLLPLSAAGCSGSL